MIKMLIPMLLIPLLAFTAYAQHKHSYKPEKGYVPDAATAVKIAEAVWLPVYGDSIYGKTPFVAELKGDVWFIRGSLPDGTPGGVPEAEIAKDDGRVLRVSHGK